MRLIIVVGLVLGLAAVASAIEREAAPGVTPEEAIREVEIPEEEEETPTFTTVTPALIAEIEERELPHYHIRGRITYEDGEPMERVMVLAAYKIYYPEIDSHRFYRRWVFTDADGRYDIIISGDPRYVDEYGMYSVRNLPFFDKDCCARMVNPFPPGVHPLNGSYVDPHGMMIHRDGSFHVGLTIFRRNYTFRLAE